MFLTETRFAMQRWENPSAGRYYQAAIQQNLFGDWELMRIWGGIGSARGRQWLMPVGDALTGEVETARVAARRVQRGYHPVGAPERDPVPDLGSLNSALLGSR